MDEEAVIEYIYIEGSSSSEAPETPRNTMSGPGYAWNWTIHNTRVFLNLYKEYRVKVGTQDIKNLKQMWEVIAHEINEALSLSLTASHCENRWRVLERVYKKHVDNQNKTGQSRKYFEYKDEMDDIFKGKRNLDPVLLLSSSTVEKMPHEDNLKELEECVPSTSHSTSHVMPPDTPTKNKLKRKRNPILSRNVTLDYMRRDRRNYQEERLKIEREKLDVQKEKLKTMKERNILLMERNQILKDQKCSVCLKDS